MGPIQGSINQLLTLGATAQKVGAHLEQQKQSQQRIEALEAEKIKKQMEREAYQKKISTMTPEEAEEYNWQLDYEDFMKSPEGQVQAGQEAAEEEARLAANEEYDRMMAQSIKGNKVLSGAEKGISQAQQSINNKAQTKQVFDQRLRTARKRANARKKAGGNK